VAPGCCHLGEPRGEGGDLLVKTAEGFQQGCLPGGLVTDGIDSVAGHGHLPG
jgi:hypothetical protein